MDHRRVWEFGDRLGAVCGCRYADSCRSVALHPPPPGDQAPDPRAVRRPAGLAGKQSVMEQLPSKLSRALALPSSPHAQIPATDCRRSGIEAGTPLEIACPTQCFLSV